MSESPLVREYLDDLAAASMAGPILDLACGNGRNGLWLAGQNLPVVFADIRREALAEVRASAEQHALPEPRTWEVDFEETGSQPLSGQCFGGIIVFRYLTRALMPAIAEAVVPGGLIIYETFTVDQAQFGRPINPDFLLRAGELPGHFPGWLHLHYYEGVTENPDSGNRQAIAQLVARKPEG